MLLKLELDAFRGATRPFSLVFDPSKRISLLYGENGTGKSTLADALVCLCTDDLGSLDDKSGADKSYLVAAGRDPEDLRLALDTTQGTVNARYSSKKIVRTPQEAPLKLRHLRRSSVVALSTAAPSARYEYLAGYFDLTGIAKSEDHLRSLVRTLKNDLDRAVSSLESAEKILEAVWQKEGGLFDDWRAWAEYEAGKDLQEQRTQLRQVEQLLAFGDALLGAADRLTNTLQLGEQAFHRRRDAEQNLAEKQAASGQDAGLLTLLQQARDHVAAHRDGEVCPVCEQPAGQAGLLQALETRIVAMAGLQTAAAEADAARREHERLQSVWQNALSDFDQALNAFLTAAQTASWPEAFEETLHQLADPELKPRKKYDVFAAARQRMEPLLEGRRIAADAIRKSVDQHLFLRENLQAVENHRQTIREQKSLMENAEKALKTVESARKAFIDEELAAVSAEVDALFQALHPGESLGEVHLFLKEKGKNSLELSARFHGESGVAPQSVYSESHLDTLALCIFMALAKRYGGSDTVLLLDDVLGACDDAHLDRFTALLQREAPHFAHVVVMTHHKAWFDRSSTAEGVQARALGPWSLEKGMQWANFVNNA